MQVIKHITVDLCSPYPPPLINVKQMDTGRGILITLTDGGAVKRLTTETVRIYAAKPDGTIVYNACTIQDGSAFAMLTNQMLAKSGRLNVEVEVSSGGDVVTTPIFVLEVLPTNIDSAAIESSNEFGALQAALREVELVKKIDKVTATEGVQVPIIDYISASGSAFGAIGFYNAADAPTLDSHWSVLWFGTWQRMIAIAISATAPKIVYARQISEGSWYGKWIEYQVTDKGGDIIL